MNDKRLIMKSKRLSWLLRFGAAEVGLKMDPAGWCDIGDVLRQLHLSQSDLEEVVRRNNKRRLELSGGRIRASQGHGMETLPVTREALEASWAVVNADDHIWHGTSLASAQGIALQGIQSLKRTHVHMARSLDSHVGKRAGVQVMLEVSPVRLRAQGIDVYASPNGVILTRCVPPDCIVGIRCLSKKAQAAGPALHALFGLTSASS